MKNTHHRPRLAAVAAALAALALSAAALADTPPPTDGGSQGKGVSTIKYRAEYTDYFYGPVSCTGVHQTGRNFESTTGGPLRGVSPGQELTLATSNRWFSDYYYFAATPSTVLWASSLTGTVSLDASRTRPSRATRKRHGNGVRHV